MSQKQVMPFIDIQNLIGMYYNLFFKGTFQDF